MLLHTCVLIVGCGVQDAVLAHTHRHHDIRRAGRATLDVRQLEHAEHVIVARKWPLALEDLLMEALPYVDRLAK